MAYCPVPSALIDATLIGKGFEKALCGREVVYDFYHRLDSNLKVRVYSSIKDGDDAVRGCGKDAIRIVVLRRDPATGRIRALAQSVRVYRVNTAASTVERLLARCREAYARLNEVVKADRAVPSDIADSNAFGRYEAAQERAAFAAGMAADLAGIGGAS